MLHRTRQWRHLDAWQRRGRHDLGVDVILLDASRELCCDLRASKRILAPAL